MIGVSEENELQSIQSAAELYAVLVGYYDRVLRVRNNEISDYRNSRYGRGGPDTRSYWLKQLEALDQIGRIKGLKLNSKITWDEENPGESRILTPSLGLFLEGQKDAVDFDQEYSQVEVLQEDSGRWKLIHRGKKWAESPLKKEENDQ